MRLWSRGIAEIKLVKNSPSLFKSEMDGIDRRYYQVETGKHVEILWMHLSSREAAETQLVKILPLWLKSEVDAVDGRNCQFQIGKKCGNFVDAFIKSISC